MKPWKLAVSYGVPGGNTLHKSDPYTFPTITKLSPWWIGRWRWGVVASCRGSRMNWRGALGSDLSPCRSILAVPSASWELWMWIHCLCQHPRDPPATKRWCHASALPTNQCDATWQLNAGPCGKRSYTLQPNNQPINQPTDRSTDRQTDWSIDRSNNISIKQ